ncbi:hypothetical protein BKI52_08485 [marine bacterium AO1-C]|nr:hypothetical protein BKI52_08485 [marine bacterium AO1-C]
MRIILLFLIGIHGFIHLFGFLQAFGLAKFNEISQSVSKTSGIIWLLAFLFFTLAFILRLFNSNYFWISGFLAFTVSQSLIFNYWSDAKFGTIPNLIILTVAIISYATFSFQTKVKKERVNMFKNSTMATSKTITQKDMAHLPPAVQKWLLSVGVLDKKPVSRLHLVQDLQLKMTPEQKNWNSGVAEQYFTTQPPAFNWTINTQMNPVLNVVGRDKLENGQGEMTIKLLSLIAVANAKQSEKVDQATLQRYLAEIVWFPSAALSPYITWEQIDDNTAKATMHVDKTTGSGIFYFDQNGYFLKFTALRYKDAKDEKPTLWTASALKTEERNGIKIPVELQADWELDSGQWTWLKIKIKDISYDIAKMPAH